jgi:hypothetical protein
VHRIPQNMYKIYTAPQAPASEGLELSSWDTRSVANIHTKFHENPSKDSATVQNKRHFIGWALLVLGMVRLGMVRLGSSGVRRNYISIGPVEVFERRLVSVSHKRKLIYKNVE